MDKNLNHTDRSRLIPAHEQGEIVRITSPSEGDDDDQASYSDGHEVLGVASDARPYAYRRPVGHPDEDDTAHPLRRRSDTDPQK